MLREAALVGALGCLGAGLIACAGSDHPERIDPATGTAGASSETGSGGSQSGAGGAGPDSPDCVADGSAGTTLTSDIWVYLNDSLLDDEVRRYDGVVQVTGNGTSGCRAEATYDGSAEPDADGRVAFVLAGLEPTGQNPIRGDWVEGSEPLVPSLMMANMSSDLSLQGEYVMFPLDVIDSIFEQLGVTRDPDRAQLITRVYGQYAPAAGVTLDMGSATVAYHLGSWNTDGPTGADGLIMALNLEASEDGEQVTGVFTGDESLQFHIRAGYITYAFHTQLSWREL